jgi:uncharacterized protein YggU (UPF0235/DUF167 family)
MIELSLHERGTVLRVKAQPNARRNGILGERAGCLRVGVTAAPEKGKANVAIAEVLAEALGCRGSGLVLLSGDTAREKRFLVLDIEVEALRLRLEPLISLSRQ